MTVQGCPVTADSCEGTLNRAERAAPSQAAAESPSAPSLHWMTDLSKHGQARAATEEIPFSLKELKQAIPQHCWERSLLHALVYVLADLTCIGALACSTRLLDLAPAWLAWSLLWPAYWFLQVRLQHAC